MKLTKGQKFGVLGFAVFAFPVIFAIALASSNSTSAGDSSSTSGYQGGYHRDINGNRVPNDCGAWVDAEIASGGIPSSNREYTVKLCQSWG
jgi:hypothetical protein